MQNLEIMIDDDDDDDDDFDDFGDFGDLGDFGEFGDDDVAGVAPRICLRRPE